MLCLAIIKVVKNNYMKALDIDINRVRYKWVISRNTLNVLSLPVRGEKDLNINGLFRNTIEFFLLLLLFLSL